ncbi:MAG: glutaminase domain-containing protein [Acidimicrobiales bacterium]
MDRRGFLALAGYGMVGLPAADMLAGLASYRAPEIAGLSAVAPPPAEPAKRSASPITKSDARFRPPAVPLAVRSPYLNAWLPGDTLPGTWPMRWIGQETQLAGIVRIDGQPWVWAGAPSAGSIELPNMNQESLRVTPTRSVFTVEAAGLRLSVEFLSPVEPRNPRLQSVPLSLITVTVAAADGRSHDVQLYADISGAWASGITSDEIIWASTTTGLARTWTVELASPEVFSEHGQMAAWGSFLWSTTPRGKALSFESGEDWTVRYQFARTGALTSTVDPNFRAIDEAPPVFAYAHDLARVTPAGSEVSFVLGHVRNPAISYMGSGLQPAWAGHWGHSWDAMVDEFFVGAPAARIRAAALDHKIITAATATAGDGYAQLCTLATPQTYGACELVTGPDSRSWAFLKEISSGSATSTVDIITAASPLWLYLDPGYLAMLLDPILSYAASPGWEVPWAPHDLGYFYPTAEGHATTTESASGEQMPVQESAGLLVLAEAYAQKADTPSGTAFLARYSKLWHGWADWLGHQLPAPPRQLTADDFIGSLDRSVNLALLGIVGLGAAGKILARLGHRSGSSHWTATAASLINRWQELSMDSTREHLALTEGGRRSWGLAYNAYLDRLMGTNLMPETITAIEAAWYEKKMERYGLALESPVPHWARAAWEGWTAAWLSDYPIGRMLIDALAAYANETNNRVPFGDTYWTTTGAQVTVWPVFDQARPVVGGVFAQLALPDQGAAAVRDPG